MTKHKKQGNSFAVLNSKNVPRKTSESVLSQEVSDEADMEDTPPGPSQWASAESKRKRKRRSTGEQSLLSVDDKLDYIMAQLKILPGIESKVRQLDKKLTRNTDDVAEIKDDIHEFDLELKSLEYRAIDQEARSRRNNLLFWGIKESETGSEDCEALIKEFLDSHLHVDASSFTIQRAHRNGRFTRSKTRSIIVNFLDFKITELIMSKVSELKGTGKGITRDFPIEILSARRRLYPKLRELRVTHGSQASIRYPAKIVVNGTTVEDEFPNWFHFLNKRYELGKGQDQFRDESMRSVTGDKTHPRSNVKDRSGAWAKDHDKSGHDKSGGARGGASSVSSGVTVTVKGTGQKNRIDINGLPIESSDSSEENDN